MENRRNSELEAGERGRFYEIERRGGDEPDSGKGAGDLAVRNAGKHSLISPDFATDRLFSLIKTTVPVQELIRMDFAAFFANFAAVKSGKVTLEGAVSSRR